MSFQHLPRELVDLIIDFLHDDRASLASCSLVHTAWSRPSQFHLLSYITISASHPHRPAPELESLLLEFLVLLRTSPRSIGYAVRHFNVTSATRVPSNPQPQPIKLQTVLNLLEYLPSMKFLTLSSVTLQACSTIRSWKPSSLKLLLLSGVISDAVTDTETSAASSLIRRFHSIDRLSIGNGSSSCKEGVPERLVGKVRVTDLTLGHYQGTEGIGLCQLPLHTVALSSVQSLDARLSMDNAEYMNIMSHTIRNCTGLKVLRTGLECFITDEPFQWTLLALDSLPSLQSIEWHCVVFVADEQDVPGGMERVGYLERMHGAHLIASLSRLRSLKSFAVRIRFHEVGRVQPLTNIASALRSPILWKDVFASLLLLPACVEKLAIQFLMRPSLLPSAEQDPKIVEGVKTFIRSALQASSIPLVIEFIYEDVVAHIS